MADDSPRPWAADCPSVHGRAVERRQRRESPQLTGQRPSAGVSDINLDPRKRLRAVSGQGAGLRPGCGQAAPWSGSPTVRLGTSLGAQQGEISQSAVHSSYLPRLLSGPVSTNTLVVYLMQATNAMRVTACEIEGTNRVRQFRRDLLESSQLLYL